MTTWQARGLHACQPVYQISVGYFWGSGASARNCCHANLRNSRGSLRFLRVGPAIPGTCAPGPRGMQAALPLCREGQMDEMTRAEKTAFVVCIALMAFIVAAPVAYVMCRLHG